MRTRAEKIAHLKRELALQERAYREAKGDPWATKEEQQTAVSGIINSIRKALDTLGKSRANPKGENPMSAELLVVDNPRKKKRRKRAALKRCKRYSRSYCIRYGRSRRRKGRVCRKFGRGVRRKGIKRGVRLLSWKAAVKRHGVRGAMTYRRKFGIKKLKG